MKIGVISLQERIENPKGIRFEDLYQRIGLNTGNLMFTNAVFRQLDGTLTRIGFSFNPKQVNKDYDAIVIPAANWINSRSNWDWLSNLLEQVDIPVVTIGIGVQADHIDENAVQPNESSMRLIRILASKSPYVSTRGAFTRDWLYSRGIKNVIATGCPSLYLSFDYKKNDGTDARLWEVAFQSTRFYASTSFNNSDGINASLFKLAYHLKAPLIFQSEADEIRYLVHGAFSDDKDLEAQKAGLLADLYGADTHDALKEYLINYGNVFFDIDMWSRFVRQCGYVIGTRIHGSIVALLSGAKAMLIAHDSRTQEMAEFAGIPHVHEKNILVNDLSCLECLKKIISDDALGRFWDTRKRNALIYRQFIESVGLSMKAEYEV